MRLKSNNNCSCCPDGQICEERFISTANNDLRLEEDPTHNPPSASKEGANIDEYGLISSKISSYFPQALEYYHRLIVVPVQCDYKINFQQVAESSNSRYINVNLKLSKLLLELTQKQRSLKAERLLKQIIGNTNNEIIFLEHLEILFDTSLQLDPLRCLQKLARPFAPS